MQLAREKGLNMWSEYYPYAAGSTTIAAAFLRPSEWVEKRGYKYEDTIYDPIDDKYLTNETYAALMKKDPGRSVVVEFPYRKAWMNHWLAIPHMTIAVMPWPVLVKMVNCCHGMLIGLNTVAIHVRLDRMVLALEWDVNRVFH